MANNKVEQVEMEAIEVEEIVEETKVEGFKAKAKNMLEKHGKKLAIGAGIATAIGVVIAVVKALATEDEDENNDVIDAEFEVTEFDAGEVTEI